MFYLVAMLSMASHLSGPLSIHTFGPMTRSECEAHLPSVRDALAPGDGYRLDTMCTTRDKVEMVVMVGKCSFIGSFPGPIERQQYRCRLVARND